MLVGFAEGLAAAKAYAARNKQQIDVNRELVALGGANLASGLKQRHGGQRQPLQDSRERDRRCAHAGVGAGRGCALTVVALLFLTGLFEDLPQATLAAIVIAAVVELIDVPALIDLYNTYTKRLGRQFGGGVSRVPTSSPRSPPCWG